MDRIAIPDEQIVPMESIAPGVRGLRVVFVNVFAVTHPDNSWTLIDASIPFTSTFIQRWAEKFAKTPPNAIVLTHGHFDHASAALDLADHWDVPIYAHPLEAPYLTGQKEYPPPNAGAGGGMMSLLSPFTPRGPIDLGNRLRVLPHSELSELPEMPGWTIIHTPGHTAGHISVFGRQNRCLFVGDAFSTTKPESLFDVVITQPAELHGPPAYFTSDWTSARQSVEKLAELEPLIIGAGHGHPLKGASVPDELRRLAREFDTVAVPKNTVVGLSA